MYCSISFFCKVHDFHSHFKTIFMWSASSGLGMNCSWREYENKCYFFSTDTKKSWAAARHDCVQEGGDLVSITSAGEDYLKDLELPTWIGLSDLLVENQYAWSDGVSAVLYTNWNDKEPNNAGGAEHCVAMTHGPLVTGKWNDDACSKNHSFVCYRKKCQ
uniref:C-type lectin domain-containing protein n=1 Tax=Lates calcarifer TaxID=8187 RepID=A0A4W6C4N3_LATCA